MTLERNTKMSPNGCEAALPASLVVEIILPAIVANNRRVSDARNNCVPNCSRPNRLDLVRRLHARRHIQLSRPETLYIWQDTYVCTAVDIRSLKEIAACAEGFPLWCSAGGYEQWRWWLATCAVPAGTSLETLTGNAFYSVPQRAAPEMPVLPKRA